jgi:chromosome segregation ATPase
MPKKGPRILSLVNRKKIALTTELLKNPGNATDMMSERSTNSLMQMTDKVPSTLQDIALQSIDQYKSNKTDGQKDVKRHIVQLKQQKEKLARLIQHNQSVANQYKSASERLEEAKSLLKQETKDLKDYARQLHEQQQMMKDDLNELRTIETQRKRIQKMESECLGRISQLDMREATMNRQLVQFENNKQEIDQLKRQVTNARDTVRNEYEKCKSDSAKCLEEMKQIKECKIELEKERKSLLNERKQFAEEKKTV